uniref:Uncharacterized protein n=1 Tax=Lactuca sativa TaxID=4236 RepID=A0A9R1XR35_LACSA|nr:hypothetical protein LSAT_V11C200078030 [Lactuca sativa]
MKYVVSKIIFTNGSQDLWRRASKQVSSESSNAINPSYIISCHNCGHGSDLRGCPQFPSAPEGSSKSCSSPDAVEKVRHEMIQQIDLWLAECHAIGKSSI